MRQLRQTLPALESQAKMNDVDSPRRVRGWLTPIVVAFSAEIFFASSTVLGYTYQGSSFSGVYVTYVLAIAALGFGYAAKAALSKGRVLRGTHLTFLLLPMIVGSIYLLDSALSRTETLSQQYLLYFLVFAAPAAAVGAMAAQSDLVKRFSLALEPMMLVFTGAAFTFAIKTISTGWNAFGLGGATYQTASYLGGAAFSFNLYHIILGESNVRWGYTHSKWYRVLSYALLPLQGFAVLVSGGRGGFVLLVINLVLISTLGLRSSIRRVPLRLIGLTAALSIAATYGIPELMRDAELAALVNRVFSYLGEGGIDWEGTSNRDQVYADAIVRISEAPFFGYGLISWGGGGYPHNLVLEWLLNGGVIYAAAWALMLLALTLKLTRMGKASGYLLIMVPLTSFPLTMLMFSGTYWASGPFWFCVSLLASLSRRDGRGQYVHSQGNREDP